nr:TadE family protein [Methylomarinum sp. Ch1-1]MDP4519872.1 pilus assembly protein [Methylomarinum sp. Ch1-1]
MRKLQRGASMVEFALIALVFFTLIFGIIEFARVMFVYNTLVEATRRGARVAAVCPVSAGGYFKPSGSRFSMTPPAAAILC